MTLVVPKMGLRSFLSLVYAYVTSVEMRLYKNDVNPVYGTQTIELEESDYIGYSPITLSGWTAPAETGDGVHWNVQMGPFIFPAGSATSAQPVYGYYVLTPGGDISIAERFEGGPFDMGLPGQTLQVDLTFTARSEF